MENDNGTVKINNINNSNKININQGLELINIIPENLSLYLNMIGGHSFFVVYSKKYLIKSIGEKELKFYEFLHKNQIEYLHLPKFYGLIEKNTKQHQSIIIYKKKCDKFFQNMIQYFGIKSTDIDIENDLLFKKKFQDFINEKNDIELDNSFEILKEELIQIKKNCQKRLYWIFFWYIKWQKEFISDRYIIIQNLEYNTKMPSIIDIKLGSEKKISKETGKVKIFKGANESLGCRIMGLSSNNLYFKSRYETKELNEDEFTKELNIFFGNKKHIITPVISELENIIKFTQKHFLLKIYFCSLLIFFDNSEDNNEVTVKLIDFDLTNNIQDWNLLNEMINNPKNEQGNIQDNSRFINCMNNLIMILRNINK